jgi:hypothetical protein
MTNPNDTSARSTAENQQRKPWVKPALQKIRAGDAEVGTRTTPDGAFTTS